MDYFEKNIECIKQIRPRLYELVQQQAENNENLMEITVKSQSSKDGNQYLTISRNEVEYRMNSNYRPLEEAQRWAKQFEFINMNIVFHLYGFGNGYCIRELIPKLRKGDHIIVIEPSYKLFLHVLQEYDITDILQDVRVSLAIQELDIAMTREILNYYVDWINLKSQMKSIHPQYDKCFYDEYKKYLMEIDENDYRKLVGRNTQAYFGKELTNNTIFNYRYIPNSNYILELQGKFRTDIPAIIVAAGPSLDRNIEELKKAKGKAVVFATDTALRYLYRHGIKADFAITVDPQKPVSYFENCGFESIPLFCGCEANRFAVSKNEGRKIWINSHEYFNSLYRLFGKQISSYNSGGSVATAAYSVCVTLGFETIILIGQDLAYSGEITHAGGGVCNIQNEEKGICYVEGIDGNPIKTRHDWNLYRKWFENSIASKKNRVIDATEGGAKIHGAEIMTLRDAIAQNCKEDVNVRSILDEIPLTYSASELKLVYQYLEEACEYIITIPERAKEVVTICNKGLDEIKKSNRPEKLAQIGKQVVDKNNLISKHPAYLLIDSIIKHDVVNEIEDIYVINQDKKSSFIDIFESTKKVLVSVGKAAKEIEPSLKEAIEEFKQYVRSE